VADNTSGNSEELKLRITPELDDAALKKVQDQLDDIKGTVQLGGKTGAKGSVSTAETTALKDQLSIIKLLKSEEDVYLRKKRIASNERIQFIKQEAAANKISMQQMNESVLQHESIIEQTTSQAIQMYDALDAELQDLKITYAEIPEDLMAINKAEMSVMTARQRAATGFDSMSGSMEKVVSQTKMANLAFMNFGRIVQDAPFGLIGIANNIDPLLVSFQNLSNEMDENTQKTRGAMGAFKAMGAQLFGPAGLIFLLGSALPSALLLLQKRQQDTTRESNILAEAFKKVTGEFSKLAAEAAGKRGISVVTQELTIAEKALKKVEKEISTVSSGQRGLNEALSRGGAQLNDLTKEQSKSLSNQIKENETRLKALNQTKEFLSNSVEQLKVEKERINASKFITEARKELGLAESLSLKEAQERQKELNDLKQEQLDIEDEISAEIFRQSTSIQTRINELRSQLIKEEDIQRKAQLQRTISALEEGLTKVEERVRAKFAETLSKSELEALRKRQEFLARFNQFVDEVNRQSLIGTIQLEDNRLTVVKEFFQKVREEYKKEVIQQRKDFEALFIDPFQNRTKLFDQKQQASLDMQLMAAEINGDKITQIEIDRITRLKNLEDLARKNNLLGTKQYEAARAAIELDSDEKIRQSKIDSQTEIFQAVGELASASIGMIFGESKNAQVAQVVIDTIMGIQKIWSQAGLNPVVGALGSAALAAKGLAAINKIKSTTTKSSSISGGSGGATTREVMAEGIGPRAGQIINPYGTIMSANAQPTNTNMMPDISIDARVDRRGLAIAVREGEQEIRTQQFSYT